MVTSPWLSILCPSCRPDDLSNWLHSLHERCVDPMAIELSLTVEHWPESENNYWQSHWGGAVISKVRRGQWTVNELTQMVYQQSRTPYVFLSGDDTLCRTDAWDVLFKDALADYPDDVVLVYPNDLIFGAQLACYPVTSRLVMDAVPWPVPYQRYAIDDTIMDIVPPERRVYLEHVVMQHLHLSKDPPGHKIVRNGEVWYYPHDVDAMRRDRALYDERVSERAAIRETLRARMTVHA